MGPPTVYSEGSSRPAASLGTTGQRTLCAPATAMWGLFVTRLPVPVLPPPYQPFSPPAAAWGGDNSV